MQKQKWDKPELIVLVRGKPEEMVLLKCSNAPGWEPGSFQAGCYEEFAGPFPSTCSACAGQS